MSESNRNDNDEIQPLSSLYQSKQLTTSNDDIATSTTASNNNENTMISNTVASACAGIISRIFTHPLDTAKARLQAPPIPSSIPYSNIIHTNRNSNYMYKGPIDVITRTLRTEGIYGLYRGFGTVIIAGTPGTVCYLCTYEYSKQTLSNIMNNNSETKTTNKNTINNSNNFLVHFLSGMIAETIACIIYVPVDVVKVRWKTIC